MSKCFGTKPPNIPNVRPDLRDTHPETYKILNRHTLGEADPVEKDPEPPTAEQIAAAERERQNKTQQAK